MLQFKLTNSRDDCLVAQLMRPTMPDSNNAVATGSSSEAPQYIGHYRILRRLGKGGMGEIFLAEDTKHHDRKVALKELPTALTTVEARLRRAKQEAKAV